MPVPNPRPRSRLWLRIADGMAIMLILITLCMTASALWTRPQPQAPVLLAPGITFESVARFDGLVHVVTVDLRSPDVTVELAPVVSSAGDFRLVWLPKLMQQLSWNVAISGGEFTAAWGRYSPAGRVGVPDRSLILDGKTIQQRDDAAVLWFDEQQTGRLEASANSSASTSARWCLGGRRWCVIEGQAAESIAMETDHRQARTVVALDPTGCTLSLITFESATERESDAWLARRGVWRAMELTVGDDAGTVIGPNAVGVPAGVKGGPQRFITHALGIRTTQPEPARRE